MKAVFKFDREFEIEEATKCFKAVVSYGIECTLLFDDMNSDIILHIADLDNECKKDVIELMSEIADIVC